MGRSRPANVTSPGRPHSRTTPDDYDRGVRHAGLALVLLLAACEAGPRPAQPTPAVWWHSGDPPPAVAKPVWAIDADAEKFAELAAGRAPVANAEEQILAILRRN